MAILEQETFGTNYASDLYGALGIRRGLQALYDWLFPA
jgi:hypothetical protein